MNEGDLMKNYKFCNFCGFQFESNLPLGITKCSSCENNIVVENDTAVIAMIKIYASFSSTRGGVLYFKKSLNSGTKISLPGSFAEGDWKESISNSLRNKYTLNTAPQHYECFDVISNNGLQIFCFYKEKIFWNQLKINDEFDITYTPIKCSIESHTEMLKSYLDYSK